MTHLPTHFEPWVGPRFGESELGKRRLLVLGEAHYSERAEDDFPGLTNAMVRDICEGRRSIAFFTKIASLVAGLSPTEPDPPKVWESIAFYNYVQGFAASAARVRPSPEMWKAGSAPFGRVLKTVQPHHLLVAGVDLWNALSVAFVPGWTSQPASIANGEPIFQWSSTEGAHIRATWINHPASFGFSGTAWLGRLRALVQ